MLSALRPIFSARVAVAGLAPAAVASSPDSVELQPPRPARPEVTRAQRYFEEREIDLPVRCFEHSLEDLEQALGAEAPARELFNQLVSSSGSALDFATRVKRACAVAEQGGTLYTFPPAHEKAPPVFCRELRQLLVREVIVSSPAVEKAFTPLFAAAESPLRALEAFALEQLPISDSTAEERRQVVLALCHRPLADDFAAIARHRTPGETLGHALSRYLYTRDKLVRMGHPPDAAAQVFRHMVPPLEPSPSAPSPAELPLEQLPGASRSELFKVLESLEGPTLEHYSALTGSRLDGETLGQVASRYLFLAEGLKENGLPQDVLPTVFPIVQRWIRAGQDPGRIVPDLRTYFSISASIADAVAAAAPPPPVEPRPGEVLIGPQLVPVND